MRVIIFAAHNHKFLSLRRLRRKLGKWLRTSIRSRRVELSVALVDDKTIRELNREYRGVDEVTDVLSFSQLTSHDLDLLEKYTGVPEELLGDIVIDIDQARRQTDGLSLQEEVEALAAHGLLHLLGHDDETEEDAMKMAQAERRLLGGRVCGVKD